MQNIKIRKIIKDAGVCHYSIADHLKMSEMTFSRLLRNPLSAEKEKLILQAIENIKAADGGEEE